MTTKRTRFFTILFAAAIAVSLAAAPIVVPQANSLYQRLEVLGRMFEYIEMYYVEDVEREELFDLAVRGVLENLDPHSSYYSAEEYRALSERYRGDYFGIGIQFDLFDGILTVLDAIEGGPSERLGIRPGDQIVKIEGENAIGLENDAIYERLRGPRNTRVNVTVRRPALDDEFDIQITRDQVEVPAVLAATMLTPEIGYVWLSTFSEKGADQIERYLQEFEEQGMQAFVLDLRGNRGGLMSQAIRITDKFLDGGKRIVYTEGRTPNANGENHSTDRGTHPRWPMIVLVDHNSASASEIVAGALQDWDRALVAGQLTWGKALVQNQFQFSDGSALFLTIARYHTPSGRMIQRPYDSASDDDYLNPDWEAIEAQTIAEPGAEAPNVAMDRPVFRTAAGREVRGGGGIMPDVTVKPTGVNGLAVWLYGRRLTFQFATRYVSENAVLLPPDLPTYLANFEVSDAMVDDFVDFLSWPSVKPILDQAQVELGDEILAAAREDMRMYLKAHIASNLWGLDAGRIVLLQYDGQVQAAIGLVPQAADLLGMPAGATAEEAR